MSHELHYTSATRGLKPGSQGFCIVATTANLDGPVAERLEGLSGYRAAFPFGHPSARLNPPVVSHTRLSVIGQSFNVLSWVGDAGLDYSGRGNKYAHHVAIEVAERPAGGPAWLASRPGFLDRSWSGEPRILPRGRNAPSGDQPPAKCEAWGRRFNDAGWAGAVAESFLKDPSRPVYFLFNPGEDLLPLFAEAIALLPRARRWEVTFSTYFTGQDQGMACLWRGVLRDSPEAQQALRQPGALILDPSNPPPPATGGPLVHQARTGEVPLQAVEPEPAPRPKAPGRLPGSRPTTSSGITYEIDDDDEPTYVRDPRRRAPATGGRPRPISRTSRTSRADQSQLIIWGSVAVSLIFLIGAGTAWIILRKPAQPFAQNGGEQSVDGSDRTKPDTLEPQGNDHPGQPANAGPSPIEIAKAIEKEEKDRKQKELDLRLENERKAREVADQKKRDEAKAIAEAEAEKLKRAESDRKSALAKLRPPRTPSITQLGSWDIARVDPEATVALAGPVAKIELLGLGDIDPKASHQSKSIIVTYQSGSTPDRPLATFSYNENTLKLTKFPAKRDQEEAYEALGNCVLSVTYRDKHQEYILLQKPLALPSKIPLAKYLLPIPNDNIIQVALSEGGQKGLPHLILGQCSLSLDPESALHEGVRTAIPKPPKSVTKDAPTAEMPEQWKSVIKGPGGVQATVEIKPAKDDHAAFVSVSFSPWSITAWRKVVEFDEFAKFNKSPEPTFISVKKCIDLLGPETILNPKQYDKNNLKLIQQAEVERAEFATQLNEAIDKRNIAEFRFKQLQKESLEGQLKDKEYTELKELPAKIEEKNSSIKTITQKEIDANTRKMQLISLVATLELIQKAELEIELWLKVGDQTFLAPLADTPPHSP